MEGRDSFIFYKSFYEAIEDLDTGAKVQLYDAICRLALYDEEIEITGVAMTMFKLIKPQLKANTKRFEDGKKGGRPKEKTTGYDEEKTTGFKNKKPNNNVNVNDNVNVNLNNNITTSEETSTVDTAKASKKKYGEYKHVLLKDEELQKLKEEYQNWEELIIYLDEYIEMKGYKAKSHYLAIKKWVIDAVEKQPKRQATATKKDSNSDFWEQMIKEYDGGSNNDNE